MIHKLIPPPGKPYLLPADVVTRLRDEFEVVEVDPGQGRDYAQAMLLQVLKLQQSGREGCDEHIDRLQQARETAVMVVVTDDLRSEDERLRFAVVPDEPIVVGYYSRRHQRLSESLLQRCADVLGYQIAGP